jgi:GR25 family glycosyltransferase involved in LPS biosynthesis
MNQFKDIKYPFPVKHFFGYTPETSMNYILDRDPLCPEDNGTICCFRSHIAAMDQFKNEDVDFVLVLEDDCSLHWDFKNKLVEAMKVFDKYTHLDFLWIGYNMNMNIYDIQKTFHCDQELFYDIESYNKIWGCQGILYRKKTLTHLSSILHHSDTLLVRKAVKEYLQTHTTVCRKHPSLQSDALIPLLSSFGVLYPPLVIERGGLKSSIDNRINDQHKLFSQHPQIHFSNYLNYHPLSSSPKILTVILTVNQSRCIQLMNQFKEIKYPFPIQTFFGYTPSTSSTYIQDKDPLYPEANGTICCFRSHIAALNHFKDEDIDYLLVLEDDSSIHSNFTKKLLEVIDIWNNHPDLDYIWLGYNLGVNINQVQQQFNYHHDRNLFYDMSYYNQIWGCQARIYKKDVLHHLCSILHQSSTTLVRESVKKYMDQKTSLGQRYCNKYPRLQSDALIPLCAKFGLYYPPLAIEKQGLESSIDERYNNNINKNHHLHSQIQFHFYL